MKMKNNGQKFISGKKLMAAGLLLLAAALCLTLYNCISSQMAAGSSAKMTALMEQSIASSEYKDMEIPLYKISPKIEMPVVSIDGHDCIGIIEIPALDLTLPVISEWSYSNLRSAPCRYTGSAYLNNMVIAAHNYSRHFGNLKFMQPGTSLRFTDADGNVFNYSVSDIEYLDGTQVEEMQAGEWDLTLFTCTYGGAQRVTVRCTLTDTTESGFTVTA